MIVGITVEGFKNIEKCHLDPLNGIDILIGGNNAGKSSVLQAIQFGISIVQTLRLDKPLRFDRGVSLSPEQIIYSPIKDVYLLVHGANPMRENPDSVIRLTIAESDGNSGTITIKKGRNKNILVELQGRDVCEKMADINHAYSMYVPGLAGIPFVEEYRSLGAIRRVAAKGDCNTIFRNVLYHLKNEAPAKMERFIDDLNAVFPGVSIDIDARLDNDGIIDVNVTDGTITKPIDAMGTGLLQAIQICAYANFFEPRILLLDEPDSHLHPNNQKLLSQMLVQISKDNQRNIIAATHSRHLVGALRKDSQIFFMKNGEVVGENYDGYSILMEIGALDEYDVIRNPDVKYVILTEDESSASNGILKLLFESSGFEQKEFTVLPYSGCTNVTSAMFLAKGLSRFRSDLTVIIHRDSDGMYEHERSDCIEAIKPYGCFLTDYNDIECYLCTSDHISEILSNEGKNFAEQDVTSLIAEAQEAVKEDSRVKFLNRKLDPVRQGRGNAAVEAHNYFEANMKNCLDGHLLLGKVVSLLHTRYNISKEKVLTKSRALNIEQIRDLK